MKNRTSTGPKIESVGQATKESYKLKRNISEIYNYYRDLKKRYITLYFLETTDCVK